MIALGVDFDLETLFDKYKRIGLSMPVVVLEYNNSMAFNTRSLSKRNLIARTTPRSGSIKYITGGRVLSVKKARFSRNVDSIHAEVGGRIVSQARDPDFMARLEFGGSIPQGKFGQTAIPTVKGARKGDISKSISSGLSVPRLAAQAVSAKNMSGSPRQKRAVAMAIALRERKKTVKMRDTRGRMSLYRVTGRGRGRNRVISNVDKTWTLSTARHNTRAYHWLSDASDKAISERTKVFRRIAEKRIGRDALKARRF